MCGIFLSDTMVWVIYHPMHGVYLGHAKGQSFWTNIDTAGQPCATTFSSKHAAVKHSERWSEAKSLIAQLDYYRVESGGPFDLAAAKLDVGDMFENLKNAIAVDPRASRDAGGPSTLNS